MNLSHSIGAEHPRWQPPSWGIPLLVVLAGHQLDDKFDQIVIFYILRMAEQNNCKFKYSISSVYWIDVAAHNRCALE